MDSRLTDDPIDNAKTVNYSNGTPINENRHGLSSLSKESRSRCQRMSEEKNSQIYTPARRAVHGRVSFMDDPSDIYDNPIVVYGTSIHRRRFENDYGLYEELVTYFKPG